MRAILRRIFLVDRVREDGILLDIAGPGFRFVRFHVALGNIIADGDALRSSWSCKGASGKLPCPYVQ